MLYNQGLCKSEQLQSFYSHVPPYLHNQLYSYRRSFHRYKLYSLIPCKSERLPFSCRYAFHSITVFGTGRRNNLFVIIMFCFIGIIRNISITAVGTGIGCKPKFRTSRFCDFCFVIVRFLFRVVWNKFIITVFASVCCVSHSRTTRSRYGLFVIVFCLIGVVANIAVIAVIAFVFCIAHSCASRSNYLFGIIMSFGEC